MSRSAWLEEGRGVSYWSSTNFLESFTEDVCKVNPSHLLVSLLLGYRWWSNKRMKYRVKNLGAHYVSDILTALTSLSISSYICQRGMTLSAKGITVSIWGKSQSREHRISQVHANGFPVTVMPLILELEHTRVMMLKFGRLIMGLQQSPYSSWHESHTIACFVTFILRAHEPIFHQFLKIWLGGIIISGHLVML